MKTYSKKYIEETTRDYFDDSISFSDNDNLDLSVVKIFSLWFNNNTKKTDDITFNKLKNLVDEFVENPYFTSKNIEIIYDYLLYLEMI